MVNVNENQIILYGTDWCPDCILAKMVLNKLKTAFIYINVDHDPEAEEFIRKHNRGSRSVPTIVFPDNSVLTEPSKRELTEKVISLDLATGS